MSDHITGNYRAYGNRAGVIAFLLFIPAMLLNVGIMGYGIPEAAEAGTLGEAIPALLVFALFANAPWMIAAFTAGQVAVKASEFDKHTEEDDVTPCGSETVSDAGIFRNGRKVRDLSAYERLCRDAENNGGFTGYNEAVNEGRD